MMNDRYRGRFGLFGRARSAVLCAAFAFFTTLLCDSVALGTPLTFAPWRDDPYVYHLGAGDTLALKFPLAPELDSAVVLGPDGTATLPLIGSQMLAGYTPGEARSTLLRAYASVLRNPQLDVAVTEYGSAQIFVGGEVKDPGAKAVKGVLSINQAIMTAGGVLETAKTGHIVVLRQVSGEPQPHLLILDLRSLRDDGERRIHPGDVIFVPRSAIAEVDLFVKQYITSLLPFGFSLNVR